MIYPLVKYIYKGAKYVNQARKAVMKSYEMHKLRQEHSQEMESIRDVEESSFSGEGAKELYDYIDLLQEVFGFDFNINTKRILAEHFLDLSYKHMREDEAQEEDRYEERLDEIQKKYDDDSTWGVILLYTIIFCAGVYGVYSITTRLIPDIADYIRQKISDPDFWDLEHEFSEEVSGVQEGLTSSAYGSGGVTSESKAFRVGVEGIFDVGGIGWGAKGTGKLRVSTEFAVTDALHTKAHNGIDIPMPAGTKMLAPFDGVVSTSYSKSGGNQMFLSGKFNGHDVRIGMAHLKGYLVEDGTYVTRGTPICEVGNSGEHTTGSHVHFTYRVDGKLTDPKLFFNDWAVKYKGVKSDRVSVVRPSGSLSVSEVKRSLGSGNLNPLGVSISSGQSKPKTGGQVVQHGDLPSYNTAWFSNSNSGTKHFNVGNIRSYKSSAGAYAGKTESEYYTNSNGQFIDFSDPYYGVIAVAQTVWSICERYNAWTVGEMMEHYAPSSENDTTGYIGFIESCTSIRKSDPIVKEDLEFNATLIYAIARKDNSIVLPIDYIKQCLTKAFPQLYSTRRDYFQFSITSRVPTYKSGVR